MKVTVTRLHAPWPPGTAVGDVVEIHGEALPAWAAGKCEPAPTDAKAAHVFKPPALGESRRGASTIGDEARAAAAKMLKEMRTQTDDLKAQVAALMAERNALTERIAALSTDPAKA
jgi:hypothetical protein